MTTPVWPTEFYPLISDGFSTSVPDGRLVTKMERGPSKVRRATAAAPRPLSTVLFATLDNYARFQRFWEEDTLGGVLPFLIPEPMLDGLELTDENDLILTDQDDNPLLLEAWILVQFDGAPQIAPDDGLYYRINLSLAVLP